MTARRYRTAPFRDELLSDGSVRRAYSDGRQEWRRRGPGPLVSWRDARGRTGTDELLGGRVIKRRIDPDIVVYGRDLGYGRTTWSDGVLTVNETSMGGRAGTILAAVGAAGLLPVLVDPPYALSTDEEEQLRRQQSDGDWGDDANDGDDDPHTDDDWSDVLDVIGDDFG